MVYKKYIKRGGKTYGPYLYKSIKKDGRVITEYVGNSKEVNIYGDKKNTFNFPKPTLRILAVTLGIISIALLIYLAFVLQFGSTGKASLDIQNSYIQGEQLKGKVNLILSYGEFLPSSSKLRVDNAGEVREFDIFSLIANNLSEGNFYIEDKNISGNGLGYGVKGAKESFPLVSFSFKLVPEKKSISNISVVGGSGEINEPEIMVNDTNESIVNETEEPVNETIPESVNDSGSGETLPPEEVLPEIPAEEPATQPPAEESTPESSSEPSGTESVSETAPEPSSEAPAEASPITGETIDAEIIEGFVSKIQPYEYNLPQGYSIEILNSSHPVGFIIDNGKAVISTEYSETEYGFGQEYLTDEKLEIPINLTNLGIVARQGTLTISFVYQEIELTSSSKEIEVLNETINQTLENLTQIPILNTTGNNTNITSITQFNAVLGQPVKWQVVVRPEKRGEFKVEIPKEAENVDLVVVDETPLEEDQPLEGISPIVNDSNVINASDISVEFGMSGAIVSDSEKKSNTDSIKSINDKDDHKEIILDAAFKEYVIEYETPAPSLTEEEIPKGKRLFVSGSETVHYENVLVFTNLSENLSITNPGSVTIFWIEKSEWIPVQSIQDKDENGIYDYVEFIAPELSNQTFEIIVITKAVHLDENKTFISDIYDDVKELDGNWSEEISDLHYIRVTFEQNLTNVNDITLYPRVVNGSPRIEVYEINGSDIIATFESLTDNEYNKVFLTVLAENHSQNTFDLRILNGSVEFDHIIDPPIPKGEFFEDCVSISEWNAPGPNGWVVTNQVCTVSSSSKTMTYGPINLSDPNIKYAYLNYDTNNNGLTPLSTDSLQVSVSNSTSGFITIDGVNVNGPFSGTKNLSEHIGLDSQMYIRATCSFTGGGKTCRWDNIAVTSYTFSPSPMTVNLLSPIDGFINNSYPTNINFTCNVTDNDGVANVSLYSNTTGSWALNQTSVVYSAISDVADHYSSIYLGNGTYRITLQPNGAYGKDSYINSFDGQVNTNFDGQGLVIGSGSCGFNWAERRILIEFNLSKLQEINNTIEVINSNLTIYDDDARACVFDANAYKITSFWNESIVNWTGQPSHGSLYNTQPVPANSDPIVLDLTSLVKEWVSGASINFGAKLIKSGGGAIADLYSSDTGGSTTRPKLVIDYQVKSNYTANFTVQGIGQGHYVWNCLGVDPDANSSFATSNYTFYVDPCLPPTEGDWNVAQNCVVTNRVISLARDKNLQINNPGNLTLINTTLWISQTGNSISNINVNDGGNLTMLSNSAIKSINSFIYPLTVNSGSSFKMNDSLLHNAINLDVWEKIRLYRNTFNNTDIGVNIFVDNNEITASSFIDSSIALDTSSNNLVDRNNFTRSFLDLRTDSNSNNISNNNFTGNTAVAISLSSSDNYIINNTISGFPRSIRLIGFGGPSNNKIFHNLFSNAGISVIEGIGTGISSNNIFLNNSLINNAKGFSFTSVDSNNLIIDNIIINSSSLDIQNGGNNNTFINTQFNKSKVSVTGGYINVLWYLDVNVTDYQGGVNASNVTGWNSSNYPNGQVAFSELTGVDGLITRKTLQEYMQNSTGPFFSTNYTINASKGEYLNVSQQLNLTNSTQLNITLHALDQYDTCNPTFAGANLIINGNIPCSNKVIEVNSLLVNSTGTFTLTNITFITKNTTVVSGGTLKIINSKNTIWQNGNLTISGVYLLQNSTLRMNGTGSNGNIGINVSGTGNMNITQGSNITNGIGSAYRYFFIVNNGSNFSMDSSYLSYAGWDSAGGSDGFKVNTTVSNFSNNIIAGVYRVIIYSKNNVIKNNIIKDGWYGVDVRNSNNTLDNNIIFTDFGNGLQLSTSSGNNIIINNNITSSSTGLSISSNSNNVTNNSLSLNGWGLSISGSNNLVQNNTIFQNTISGVILLGNNNKIINSNITGNGHGIEFYSALAINDLVQDSIISNSVNADINFSSDQLAEGKLTLLNSTFNQNSVSFNPNSLDTLIVQWYLDVNVTHRNGSAVNQANVSAWDNFSSLYFTQNTNASGLITRQNVTEYTQDISGKIYSTNYSINTTKANYVDNSKQLNLTRSTQLDFILNGMPITSNVILNSTSGNNASSDNLTVYYNTADLDGDVLTTITDWYLNGKSLAILNMPFDTNVSGNGSIVKDYSQFQNNGTLGNGTLGTEPIWNDSGRIGGGYIFDGLNDSIKTQNILNLASTNKISVEFWIKPSSASNGDNILVEFSDDYYDYSDAWVIYFTTDEKIEFCINYNTQIIPSYDCWKSSSTINPNQWYHVAGIFDRSLTIKESKGYINGNLDGTNVSNGVSDASGNFGNYSVFIAARNSSSLYFNGTIDEVKIWNRSLSAEQIREIYNAGLSGKHPERIVHQETSVGDNWSVAMTPNDNLIDGVTVLSNNVTILNYPPNTVNVVLNTSTGLNRSSENLDCYANITDFEDLLVYANYSWYNDTGLVLSWQSLINSNTLSLVYSLPESYTKKYDNWTCSIQAYDGVVYEGDWNNATLRVLNAIPNVSLISPTDNLETYNRTLIFIWDGFDADGESDIIDYELNITCYGGCSDDNRYVSSITSENYSVQNFLKYLMDDGYYYNWSARARDSNGYGEWASDRRLNIRSLVSVDLSRDTISFGTVPAQGSNDTADNNPLPFELENNGNVPVNVTINATNLWQSVANPSQYYQFKVDHSSEVGSFDWGLSKTNWEDVPNSATLDLILSHLNWSNSNDTAQVDIKIQVPPLEGVETSVNRVSYITFIANRSDDGLGGPLPII